MTTTRRSSAKCRLWHAGTLAVVVMWLSVSPGSSALGGAAKSSGADASRQIDAGREYVTQHSGKFNGQQISYTAIVGETLLDNGHGRPGASVFTFSYLRNATSGERRPVIFAFNGGPGASSVSLHMGALGPYRVEMGQTSPASNAAPYSIVPNEFCPLDVADIVLIDPVETGFSRILGDGKPAEYLGVEQDAAEVGHVIRSWLTAHGRWNSPKFILGESYGSIRAAALVRELMGGSSMGSFNAVAVNGVMMYAIALDLAGAQVAPGNDIVYQHLLPTMAATAWYHGQVDKNGRTYAAFMQAAQEFSQSGYAAALYRGESLPADDRRRVAHELSQFIGLDEEFIMRNNLRISADLFAKNLLRSQGLIVGMYDSRYTSPGVGAADTTGDDPGMAQQSPFLVAALHDHLRNNLRVPEIGDYVYVNFKLEDVWDWSTKAQPDSPFYRTYAGMLGSSLRQNPGLEALVGSGIYDLVTPSDAAEYMATHSGMPPGRVHIVEYASGHKPYIGADALTHFSADIRRFVTEKSHPLRAIQ